MNCYLGAAISYNGHGGSSYSIGVSKEKGGARFAANEWNNLLRKHPKIKKIWFFRKNFFINLPTMAKVPKF